MLPISGAAALWLGHLLSYWGAVVVFRRWGTQDATRGGRISVPLSAPRDLGDVLPTVVRNQLATLTLAPAVQGLWRLHGERGGLLVPVTQELLARNPEVLAHVKPAGRTILAIGLVLAEFLIVVAAYDVVFSTLHYACHRVP